MNFVKACEQQFNIQNGCNTLQLGTFQYYRELDPDFCKIADGSEGTISYQADISKENPIFLTHDQFNSMTAGHISFVKPGAAPVRHGSISYSQKDGVMEMLAGGINYSGKLKIEYRYPNPYIFCISAIDDIQNFDSRKIDGDYDSFYQLRPDKINEFISFIANCLFNQLKIEDIDFGMLDDSAPLNLLSSGLFIRPMFRQVKYTNKVPFEINSGSDLDGNGIESRFVDGCFEKDLSYKDDNEWRIVFFVMLKGYGLVPMKKTPKLISINPVSEFLST